MINLTIKNGELKNCTLKGSAPELTNDCAVILRYVYNVIKENNEELAEIFKGFFTEKIEDVFKPMEEINEETKKIIKRMSEDGKLESFLKFVLDVLDEDENEGVNLKN